MDKEDICLYTHTHTHTHTQSGILEYYSAIRKNEIMQVSATWIIIPSDVSQTEKDKYHMISLI